MMTEPQFQQFISQHRETIQRLIESGALEVRNGTVFLHFNNDGILMSVKTEQKIYQR